MATTDSSTDLRSVRREHADAGCECRLCGGAASQVFSLLVLGKYSVAYGRCESCGSLQSEAPYWLDEAYTLNLSQLDTGAAQRNLDNLVACWAVARLFHLKNAIDFGGGDGLLCRLLRDRGINCFVRDKYAEPTYAQGFTEPEFERPDLVIAAEVLEHFARPREQLDELFGYEPQVLFATTAVYTGENRDWWYLSPETGQHVFFYSRKSLECVAARHRYALVTCGGLHVFVKPERLTAFRRRLLRLALNGRVLRLLKVVLAAFPASGAWEDHLLMQNRARAQLTARETA